VRRDWLEGIGWAGLDVRGSDTGVGSGVGKSVGLMGWCLDGYVCLRKMHGFRSLQLCDTAIFGGVYGEPGWSIS